MRLGLSRTKKVDDLLAAGVHAAVRDGRGNTALQYLSGSLAELVRANDVQRRLFRMLLGSGADVNARSGAGRTAAEILLGRTAGGEYLGVI